MWPVLQKESYSLFKLSSLTNHNSSHFHPITFILHHAKVLCWEYKETKFQVDTRKSFTRFQIFDIFQDLKDFMARFQDFRTNSNVWNKMLSIWRSTEIFAGKDFRKWNWLKPHESFWSSIRDAEYTEVCIKYTEFLAIFADVKISRFQISTRFQRTCTRFHRSCGPLMLIEHFQGKSQVANIRKWKGYKTP